MPGSRILSGQCQQHQELHGAYVSDVINPVERLSILGLRFDKFDNRGNLSVATGIATGIYEQKAWSPKAGMVFEAVKDRLSQFANYTSGLRNVAAPISRETPSSRNRPTNGER